MTAASDRSQRIAEIEHALANGFPSQSTVVVHADDASGRLTIQVSWVRAPVEASAREWRCAVDLRFEPDVIARYAALDTAERLRVRTYLCDLARRAIDENKPRVEDAAIECSAALDVSAADIGDALRGP
ncbi:DUF3022 domain-containing protein [Burkholderia multivorans]|uniref:DUF3022 domain-containing protein n=1 Tax=Burkholderia multivorans TaxID=87883 RepID=UPI001C232A62|nr:DUF3022 domain-containing protein [Burkholderia multivorans]MBU9222363.1 DUF3022 domain-containing protein [Burkholderia multivorans]MBU9417576.1 DUF3022 domain-containing protein [Burkholderia multivorans]HEM7907161.1 DUF3022 domain-containing protein [Burkholderia multivorans]